MMRPGQVLLRLAAILLVALSANAPLLATTAKDLYTAALTHERELRAPANTPPTLTQLRDALAAYKEIVRQYPRSGYSDNALWQAAGLAIQAFDRHRQPADRDAGVEFLQLLKHEYPSSSLVSRVADRLEQLRRLDEPAQIRAVHREPLADVVRVTIELDDEVRYHAERLDGPARLFFDFSGTYAAPPLRDATLAFDDGDIVREIRLGRHPGQITRVVLDIEEVDDYSVYSLYHPFRLVIDTVPTASMQARRATPETSTPPAAAGATGPPGTETAIANAGGDFSLGRQLGLGVSRIVIDPGHGGYDPGARTGELTESALVLDVALRLEARLAAETGIEVILTRRRDAYMPLRARTELANRVGADLFLSIHANAARNRSARGVETYYLDLATDPNAQKVAARENAAFREGMHELPNLVRSITMHNNLYESRELAGLVQQNLIGAVRKLHPGAQDLGVKQAPFVVLIGANMPSVLAEISFLTNQEDAAFLATDAYRDRIAEALRRSILDYQRTLKPSTSFAAETND